MDFDMQPNRSAANEIASDVYMYVCVSVITVQMCDVRK